MRLEDRGGERREKERVGKRGGEEWRREEERGGETGGKGRREERRRTLRTMEERRAIAETECVKCR